MTICCADCGIRTRKTFTSAEGAALCKTCYIAGQASSYLRRMEERRIKDEPNNKRTYEQCRELAAWVSVYRFGANRYRRQAAAYLNAWGGHR